MQIVKRRRSGRGRIARTRLGRAGLLIAAAATTLGTTGCSSGTSPTWLLPSDSEQAAPAIEGASVVWEDSRDADETQGTDLYKYDLTARTEALVAGGTGDQEQPAISDSYIVWIDGGRLPARDRASGTVFNVSNGPATQADPALCGSVVVWTDSRNGDSDVYARNLAGGGEIAVAASTAAEAYPDCDAGRVAYMYAPIGNSADIRLYNLAKAQTTTVSNEVWNEWRPAISGDRVVWQAWPNQGSPDSHIQIRGKVLSTGESFVVSDGPANQTAPAISGSVVVWEDMRSGAMRVWWRDLATTTSAAVYSSQAGRQWSPALSGRTLVYQSDASGVSNIYSFPL